MGVRWRLVSSCFHLAMLLSPTPSSHPAPRPYLSGIIASVPCKMLSCGLNPHRADACTAMRDVVPWGVARSSRRDSKGQHWPCPPPPGCSRSALSKLQTLVGARVCALGATAPGLLSILTYTSCSRGLFQCQTPDRSARSLEATGDFRHSHTPIASHSPRYELDTRKRSLIRQLGGGMKTESLAAFTLSCLSCLLLTAAPRMLSSAVLPT